MNLHHEKIIQRIAKIYVGFWWCGQLKKLNAKPKFTIPWEGEE